MKNLILIVAVLSVCPLTALALDSFSYSGRLVNNNGSPVAGPVDLRFDLSSTVPLTGTLCTKTVSGVQLSQGVFHVKLKFDPADCGGDAFQDVMESIPANQNMTYQVTDVTNSRTYAVQNMYAVPSSFMANFAKNLPQMGALPNQVLKWDDGLKRWVPGSAGSGDGTVKSISTDSSLTGGPITDTGTLAVATGGITNAHLAGGIDPAKLAGTRDGTTYLRGNNTWSTFGTDVLGTVLTGFSAASTSVVTATDSILSAFGKLQGQVDDLEDNKLSKTGGTLSVGTINGVPVPLFDDQVANKKYVDDQLGGVNSSQWLDAAPHIYFNTGNVGIGTGTPAEKLDVVGNISLTGRIRLKDSGTNFVELRAPLTTAGVTFVLPASAGTNGQVLKTDGTGNLSWGNSSVGSSDITDGSILDADVSASANIAQSKIANLTTDLAAKENTISAGTTAQYWRGDKTWQALTTDAVVEGTNKYFSNSLARAAFSATSPINYNNTTGVIGLDSGTTGDLLRYNGTNWVPWAPNYLTSESDTLATVTGRGATTATAVTLNGGASFPNNGIWNASGSVGIGINTPTSLLDVMNTSNTVPSYLMRLRSVTTNGVNTDSNVLLNFAESNGSNVQDWVLGTGSNTFFGHPDNFGLRTRTYNWNAFVVNPAGGGRVYLTPAGGRVGIGTTTARSTLEVAGGIQIGNDAAACDASKVGTLRYTSGNVEFCNGTAWSAFGVSGSGITNFNGSSVGSQSFATPGTTGTAPNWVTVPATGVHTLNIPLANNTGVTAGLISKSDYDAFNAKLGTATSLSGDVSGTYNATSVDKIKGTAVTITTLTSGNFLRYNGTAWVNAMLGATDIPNLDAAKITTGLLPVSRGGTNNGTLAGSRIMVSTSTSIVEAPAMTNGQLLIGSTGNTPVPATLTAGTGVTITNSAGGITIASAGSGGTVTNVTGTAPISVATGTSTPVVSISQANTTTNGYLSSTDWNTFNNKQSPLSAGPTINGVIYPASGAQNLQVSNAPVNLTDVVNLQALNTAVAAGSSKWTTSGNDIYNNNTGNVGIGKTNPLEKLDVNGKILSTGGTNNNGLFFNAASSAGIYEFVGSLKLFSNYSTLSLTNNTSPGLEAFRLEAFNGANVDILYATTSGNVGVGTTSPGAKLEVAGQVKITGGTPGAGKVLTSDAAGLATWQTPAGGADNLGNHTATQNILLGSNWLSGDGGNEGIRVDSSGKVGIGVASPSVTFEVSAASNNYVAMFTGNSLSSSLVLFQNPGSTGSFEWIGSRNNSIVLGTESADRMTIDSSGNVGIGNSAPGAKLEVTGQVKITGGSPGTGKVLTSDASGLATWQTNSATGDFKKDGSVAMTGALKAADGTFVLPGIAFAANPSTGLVNGGTNMGVIVNGNAVAAFYDTSVESFVSLSAPAGAANNPSLNVGNNSSGFFKPANGILGISTSGAERMRVDSSGNVGISNTAPTTKLHVGSASITAGTAVANFQNASGTCTMVPAASGTGMACSSDERLKENFENVTGKYALEKISKLQAVTYNFKTASPRSRQLGFKAQEVQKVAPEFVRKGSDGFLQIFYDAFIPWITEGMKELKAELAATKAENKELKLYLCKKDPEAPFCK